MLIVCLAGNFLNPGNNDICEECPVGYWNNMTEQTSCTKCVGQKRLKTMVLPQRATVVSRQILVHKIKNTKNIISNLEVLFDLKISSLNVTSPSPCP